MHSKTETDIHGYINALGLIVVLIFIALVLWNYGRKEPTRILIALVCGFAADIFFSLPFTYKCGAGNNPELQAHIPAIGLILIILFVNGQKILWLASTVLVVSGFLLCWHFSYLVFKARSYTGEPTHFSCPEKTGNEMVRKLWHTSLTGLYKIER